MGFKTVPRIAWSTLWAGSLSLLGSARCGCAGFELHSATPDQRAGTNVGAQAERECKGGENPQRATALMVDEGERGRSQIFSIRFGPDMMSL